MKIYLASTVSAIPSLMLLRFTHLSSVINLIVEGALYLLIYATLIPLMRIVTHAELQTASRILQRIRLPNLITIPVLNYQKRVCDI